MKKHILCIGDSNTHGYCADPADCADGGIRFNEDERWTCLLQKALGPEYLVTEEGLSGRTTVFEDPINENMAVLPYVYALLKSHEYVDLLLPSAKAWKPLPAPRKWARARWRPLRRWQNTMLPPQSS